MSFRIPALLSIASLAHTVAAQQESTIGYASVSEALEALQSDPAAEISVQGGWTIVGTKEDGNYVLWSFTPSGHPAHPSAVKREIMEENGAIYISMSALCQAEKPDCDALIQEFEDLNDQMKKAVSGDT
jgi:hypothetical protein